ncbi:MAG: hypothetical protein QM820_05005 [Minicystis sp.]
MDQGIDFEMDLPVHRQVDVVEGVEAALDAHRQREEREEHARHDLREGAAPPRGGVEADAPEEERLDDRGHVPLPVGRVEGRDVVRAAEEVGPDDPQRRHEEERHAGEEAAAVDATAPLVRVARGARGELGMAVHVRLAGVGQAPIHALGQGW